MHKQGAADRRKLLLSCAAADLVRLGGNHGERDAHLAEEEVHLLIVLGRLVADIHKAQDVAQFIGLLEVILHHFAPAEFLLLINLGEAVAGQINQMKAVVEQEGIDEPGFAGRLRRAREGAAVAELIDEAAFADVGFSGDGNLRQSDALELPVLRHRSNKFCFFDFQFRISFGFWGFTRGYCGWLRYMRLVWGIAWVGIAALWSRPFGATLHSW